MSTRAEREARIKAQALEIHRTQLLSKWYDQVPMEYQGFSMDEIIEEKWADRLKPQTIRKIKSYLKSPTTFLILRGEEGRGKSSMGATLAAQMIWDRQWTALYKSVPLLMDEFSFKGSEDPIGACCEPNLLFLDDVGARIESATDHQKRSMWGVINERYGREKPTIITTNMAMASNTKGIGMADWFGTSAWARIASSSTVIEFFGDSFR